jgi:hypothetical protein
MSSGDLSVTDIAIPEMGPERRKSKYLVLQASRIVVQNTRGWQAAPAATSVLESTALTVVK